MRRLPSHPSQRHLFATPSLSGPAAPVKDAREATASAQFKGAKYFGKADMYKGYFQLRLDEEAQELLAIRTPDAPRLYYPLTLPFGPLAASGPAQFQQRVSEVLGDLEGTNLMVWRATSMTSGCMLRISRSTCSGCR